jgi:alpha-beta hydrolase superfamily lysophospholipase
MAQSQEWSYQGFDGDRVARTWPNPDAAHIALLCHGYGEHIGRYEHVADALVRGGAAGLGGPAKKRGQMLGGNY